MAGTKEAKKKRGIKTKYKLILLSITILILFTIVYYTRSFQAMSVENPTEIEIEIPAGSSSKKIASILKDEGLIRNELVFQIGVKKNKAAGKLKAGAYSLNTGMDINDIISQLSKGGKNKNVLKITIPEGYEIRQMAEKLAEKGIIDKEEFLKLAASKEYFEEDYPFLNQLDEGYSLEGYLFPSTYELYPDSTEDEIIRKMLSKFEEVYEKYIKENMDDVDLSLNEIITLASIIEREAKREDERELISAVFHNRLEQGMLLQSCATVQYILGERKEVLSNKDTQIESEYNTYIHEGLPPAPIASPGEGSIVAAIQPAKEDYLYFRTKEDGTGAHTFSKTYKEHLNANPNK